MLQSKLTTLLILSTVLLSCTSKNNDANQETVTTDSRTVEMPTIPEPEVNTITILPSRHEPVTTQEEKVNGDGSITTTTVTTDGVDTRKTENTSFPNSYTSDGTTKDYSTNNFEEAYIYARKAYVNSTDVETANDYLKKAMSYFEYAGSDADDVNCDNAKSSASDGYVYAKKGYNETDPGEVERYAKKAMNEAENGKNAMEDCKRNQ